VLALVGAGVCLLTGVFLAAHYAPTWAAAQPSVAALHGDVGLGAFLRGLHHWAGTLAIAGVALDLLVGFARATYRKRRPWIDAVALLALMVAFAYTGYLLVGDRRAHAGIVVLEGVVRATPLLGDTLAAALLGGPVASSATLARLYALHALVLPALLFWIAARRRREIAPHAPAAAGLLAAIALLAWLAPPAVGVAGAPGEAPAADARPEWFFLWVNELLFRVDGLAFWIGGVLPLGLLGALFALPFVSSARTRKLELAVGGAAIGGVLTLSLLAATREPPDAEHDEPAPEAPAPETLSPELQETLAKTLRRYRCVTCHRIAGDPDGGEDGPPLPRGEEFARLYTRPFFRVKVGDPKAFWPDTGMTYPRNRKPTADELNLLERYFYGD
jgi:quinol-cytochrome oxidoreductase complex cytochrome b subunit